MTTVLFYISGHGYGHAVRMAEVIQSLQHQKPDWRVIVRSQVSPSMLPSTVEFHHAEIDSGVVERRAGVVMDEDATVDRLRRFLSSWDDIAARETVFVRDQEADLIVADIPPIAGDVARLTRRPCIAISNFTWDWIYEPYASEHLKRLEDGYAAMSLLLRLPFHQQTRLEGFPAIIDVPLIARKHADLRAPGKIKVLLGSRAEVPAAALERVCAEAAEFELLLPGTALSFTDAFAACDLVIAKLGFSMLAECIAAQKPILYPPRENFREETLLQAHAGHHVAAMPIPLVDFYQGNWVPFLLDLAAHPPVTSNLPTNGAEFCARFLAEFL